MKAKLNGTYGKFAGGHQHRGGWRIWVEFPGQQKRIAQTLINKTESEAEAHRMDWLRSCQINPAIKVKVTKQKI